MFFCKVSEWIHASPPSQKPGPQLLCRRTYVPSRRVYVDGRQIVLTAKEFDILACLAVEPGRVVSREEIFDRAWDEHWYGPRKVLDVHMAALRRKLGDPALIETAYGRGFRLADPAP